MSLSEEQTKKVALWVEEGASLSDIQRRIEAEFEVRMTYMDVRFLVDDLNLELQAEGPKFVEPLADSINSSVDEPGRVTVTIDKVRRPDALLSGQVTFSDGVSAQWFLDQMGRLSLNPKQPGYQPSPEDVAAFQTELRAAVENSGGL